MWKRILVLVLFLFGVFWWLTNRDQTPDADSVNPDTEVETSVEEGDSDDNDEKDDEDEDSDEDDADEKEETSTEVETKTTTTASTTTETTATETTEVVAPVVVTPAPAPIPAVTSDATVYLYEWGLDMNQKTFPAGTINFTVQNDGRFTHEFNVRGIGNLGKITPSATETFSVKLRPGQYEVFSDRREDYERGVRDMITVE